MKHSIFVCYSFLLLSIASGAQENKLLDSLLDRKEYFRLERELTQTSNEKNKAYYQCFIDNAFNRNDQCIKNADSFLNSYASLLTDSQKMALLLLKADCYFKKGDYAKAAKLDSIVLTDYSSVPEHSVRSEIENECQIRKALQFIPPQQITNTNGTRLQWKKDRMGLIAIPVTLNNNSVNSIIDTKANLSCITVSYAEKLKLKILDAIVQEGSGITGISFKNGLGVADSLYVGEILVKNVVFLIMPDDKLQFGPYTINLIIGYPVLEQLGELQFYKDGRMIVPVNPDDSIGHNMALDGLNPVVSVKAGNDSLCFHIDLGAQQSRLYATYFEKYKETVERDSKKTSVKIGGAGGTKRKDVYVIPQLYLTLSDKNVVLKKITVFTEKLSSQERYYGILGMDFISNFSAFTINFKSMYFTVK